MEIDNKSPASKSFCLTAVLVFKLRILRTASNKKKYPNAKLYDLKTSGNAINNKVKVEMAYVLDP
jgi:hypothetical protein